MANSKQWSVQSLVEQTYKKQDENGNEVLKTKNVLLVCISGMRMFKKHFKDDKYKGKDKLVVPFDFVALGGDLCTKGRFYEMEYSLSENGFVYRGLIQAVNPVTDIRMVVAALKREHYLPENINPRKAWLREDIDSVQIGSCFKDEEGEICYAGGIYSAQDSEESMAEYTKKNRSACIYFYRGDHREAWTGEKDIDGCEKIMVCGSENVDDPVFAKQRAEDILEMHEHVSEAISIAEEYNLRYVIAMEAGAMKDGTPVGSVCMQADEEYLKMIDNALKQSGLKKNNDADIDWHERLREVYDWLMKNVEMTNYQWAELDYSIDHGFKKE